MDRSGRGLLKVTQKAQIMETGRPTLEQTHMERSYLRIKVVNVIKSQ